MIVLAQAGNDDFTDFHLQVKEERVDRILEISGCAQGFKEVRP